MNRITQVGAVLFVIAMTVGWSGPNITSNAKQDPLGRSVAVMQAQTGMMSGVVSPSSSNSTVTAYSSADTATASADTTTGTFMFMTLPAGSYTVHVMPGNMSLNDTTISNVSVVDGQTTNLGTIQLSSK